MVDTMNGVHLLGFKIVQEVLYGSFILTSKKH